jgi:hypothetical protein
VMLEWSSKRFEVTLEGFDLIKQIIAQYQICPRCYKQTDQETHLLVSRFCLECIITTCPSLTFVGVQGEDYEGRKIYSFTNQDGMIFTSKENSSDKPTQDVAYSITQAGFSVPTKYKPFKSTEEVALDSDSWEIYGKVSQSVVVLHYAKGRIEADFLAYKKGQTIEFNKRTTEHKNMLEKARVLLERTKKNGYYQANGYSSMDLHDSYLFFVIAQLESAVYDAQLAFLANQEPEQPQQTLFSATEASTGQEKKQSRKRKHLQVVPTDEVHTDGESKTTEE